MAIASNFPAIKPSLSLDFANTKRLDSRVTFTRTTTATYYDGVTTAKAEENLFLYSQEFDNAAWATLRATVSANSTTAPDGTATADSLTQQTGQTTSGAVYTLANINYIASTYIFSVFAKPNGKNFIRLAMVDGGSVFRECYFNVNSGTVGTANNGAVGTITASANGYYRCSISYTFASASSMSARIFLADVDNSSTVVDSGGAYIWGAQLEQRSSVTAYTATTTQPITNYIPVLLTAASGVARFDHNPTTDESLGLLIEEARTNLLTYSADLSNAAWTKNASSITSNTIVAPDGTLTGDKAIANTSATEHFFEQTCSTNTNQSYTQTIYVKRGEESQFSMMVVAVGASTTTSLAKFSISAGGVVTADGGIAGLISSYSATNVGNGWYRCSIVYTLNGTVTSHRMRIYPGSNSASAVGNDFNGSYFWGAQIEVGAFPTSYIATTAATVTRNADIATMTGSNFTSWYNQAQGTFVLTAATSVVGAPNFPRFFWVRGSDTTNTINAIQFRSAGQFGANVTTNNVSQGDVTVNGLTANTLLNGAVSYAANDVAVSFNGSAVATDTSVVLPVVNTLEFGNVNGAAQMVTGYIKKLAYYPLRVTNANLQALTS